MQSNASSLPDYENPPVVEVVFGIRFESLRGLKAPHTGIFWDELNREKYPECEERSPIIFIPEVFGDGPLPPSVSIEQFDHPPLSRLLFVNKIKNHLIQIQQDGFFQNWRKLQADTKYPRYAELFPKLQSSWRLFTEFVNEQSIGDLKINQYELTYINNIPHGQGWMHTNEIGNVFCDFHHIKGERFLAEPESIGWRRIYRFPDNKGRLHVRMNQAVSRQTMDQVFVLDLTARGYSDEGMKAWFDMAHEWIVRGFADLTTSEIQEKVWKKE